MGFAELTACGLTACGLTACGVAQVSVRLRSLALLQFALGHVTTMLGWNHSMEHHRKWIGVDHHLASLDLSRVLLGFRDAEGTAG